MKWLFKRLFNKRLGDQIFPARFYCAPVPQRLRIFSAPTLENYALDAELWSLQMLTLYLLEIDVANFSIILLATLEKT